MHAYILFLRLDMHECIHTYIHTYTYTYTYTHTYCTQTKKKHTYIHTYRAIFASHAFKLSASSCSLLVMYPDEAPTDTSGGGVLAFAANKTEFSWCNFSFSFTRAASMASFSFCMYMYMYVCVRECMDCMLRLGGCGYYYSY
jgi:hypothetical protein